ncbi:hypothetical protein JYT95_00525 [bacterium AH-315-J23]|nr:hypothetical protein [bacterium AH-315-J23]
MLRIFGILLGTFLGVLLSFGASAGEYTRVISAQAKSTALTIYPDNLALITETRTIDLPAGKSTIVFEGVSDRMIPASILLREFTGLTLERNFDYALLSKANLFEKSIGEYVTLTRTHTATGKVTRSRAKIISSGTGTVFEIDGELSAYQCSGLSEGTRFDNLPEGLTGVAELSIDVATKQAGTQEVVISYLADNFSWAADYRLDLATNNKSGNLAAWITMNNNTARTFKNTPTAIIAGQLNRSAETRAPVTNTKSLRANCWPNQSTQTPVKLPEYLYSEQTCWDGSFAYSAKNCPPQIYMETKSYMMRDEIVVTASRRKASYATPAPPSVQQEDLGDYKLYRISEPINVAAYQTKQIRFFNVPDVKVKKLYTVEVLLNRLSYNYNGDERGKLSGTQVEFRLDNEKDGPLAKPLPKGTLQIFQKTAEGKTLIIGQASVRDTPIGIEMKAKPGSSNLVQVHTSVTRTTTKKSRKGAYKVRLNLIHTISNATDQPALVEFKLPTTLKSLKFDRKSHTMDPKVLPNGWTISVPANSTKTLKYRASYIDG